MSETTETSLLTDVTTNAPAAESTTTNDAAPGDAAAAETAAAGADADNKTDAGDKPAEEAAGDENSKSDGEAAEGETDEGVPESYSLKPPEGFDGIDQEAVDAVTPVAKELGLSNTKLQKLADVFGPLVQSRVESALKENQEVIFENHRKQVAEWVETVKADKDLGGADFQKKLGQAAVALDRFGSPALREFLSETKLGSHPEVVRFCFEISKSLVEDGGLVRGAPKNGTRPKSDAEVFFPELTNSQGA